MAPKPTPASWTLLLKHGLATILLSVTKDQSFTSIASDLLAALASRARDGTFASHSLASSDASEIEFAAPIDPRELSKGFAPLFPTDAPSPSENIDDDDGTEDGAGDAKHTAKRRKLGVGQRASVTGLVKGGKGAETPAGQGLKDGSVLAFRWRGDEDWNVVVPEYDYDDAEEAMAEKLGGRAEGEAAPVA